MTVDIVAENAEIPTISAAAAAPLEPIVSEAMTKKTSSMLSSKVMLSGSASSMPENASAAIVNST